MEVNKILIFLRCYECTYLCTMYYTIKVKGIVKLSLFNRSKVCRQKKVSIALIGVAVNWIGTQVGQTVNQSVSQSVSHNVSQWGSQSYSEKCNNHNWSKSSVINYHFWNDWIFILSPTFIYIPSCPLWSKFWPKNTWKKNKNIKKLNKKKSIRFK